MGTVVVTGSRGFIGRNLIATLSTLPDVKILTFDVDDEPGALPERLAQADFVFHLAGINRPQDLREFTDGKVGLTQRAFDFPPSVTRPGIARGDHHWHHTKTEKFLVVSGEAVVRFRQLEGTEVIEYPVSGGEPRVVDIPPGYTHSITNTGDTDLVTLFWASEPFDPGRPDTHALPV